MKTRGMWPETVRPAGSRRGQGKAAWRLGGLSALALGSVGLGGAAAQAQQASVSLSVDETPILVDLRDDMSEEARAELSRALGIRWRINNPDNPAEQIYRVAGDAAELSRLQVALKGDERVERVELEAQFEASAVPNDPLYPYQWHMGAVGVPAARDQARGAGVVVAVIDTGVTAVAREGFARVEDLAEGGFVPGYNFVADSPYPGDDHGHGTHVAGTIAQATHNALGAAGVAPAARIMPLKVLNGQGFGGTADIADAVRYAADHGAQVINMSLGGWTRSQILEDACQYALDKGVTVVAAAGNAGQKRVGYPAGYPGVLAVAASRFDGQLAPYSNRGERIDLTAPGGDLRVDQNGDGRPDGVLQNTIQPGHPDRNGYYAYQGTSMASPHVAGAAALLVGVGVSTPADVARVLKSTAAPMPPNHAADGGTGLLRADRAVSRAYLWQGAWLTLLALVANRFHRWLGRRKLNGVRLSLGLSHYLGLSLAGVGLFALPLLGAPLGALGPFVSLGFSRWYIPLFGAWSPLGAVFFSAAAPALLVALTFPLKGLNRVAGGFAVGMTGVLLAALVTQGDVPGVPGWMLERVWLSLNAVGCLFAAFLTVRRRTADF